MDENYFDNIFDELSTKGYCVMNNLLEPNFLNDINAEMLKLIDIKELSNKNLVGFKMGNLAIHSSVYHQRIWEKLKKTKLITYFQSKFDYKYVTCGGNLNLPNSTIQKIHYDSNVPNLIINIPLVEVNKHNGAMGIVPSSKSNKKNTLKFYIRRNYKKLIRIDSNLGDVILRFTNTWHRGNTNFSNNPRIVLSFILRKKSIYKNKEQLIHSANFGSNKLFKISGNMYPESKLGHFMENVDLKIPVFKTLEKLLNIVKGG